MPQNGRLRLNLVDVFGKRLQERVDVSLRNLDLTHAPVLRGLDASKVINITDLFTGTHGHYEFTIDPPSYHPVGGFVDIKSGSNPSEETIIFPIDSGKVVSVIRPTFPNLTKELRTLLSNSPNIPGAGGLVGEALYQSFDDIRRAGILNIARKSLATRLNDTQSVLSLIREVREVRGDRFFAFVDRQLREETIHNVNTGLFHEVNSILHSLPPQFVGFEHAKSFKTGEAYGNLQLTFFKRGEDFVADIDIDDAGGLGHLFQVLRNHFTGNPTHPYNIHQILIRHQRLDPGYRFNIS
ncbi:MAG TPA: hypothetical protein VF297_29210 [Pyrinomonadaceae bacterium]